MKRIYKNRIIIFLTATLLTLAGFVVSLSISTLRLASIFIFCVWLFSQLAIVSGDKSLSQSSERIKRHLFKKYLNSQYLIRSLAFLLVIQKAFGTDSKYALLMVLGLISFIAASVIFADLIHRLVRGEVEAVGFPKSVNSDVSREKIIDVFFKFDKNLASLSKYIEPLLLLSFLIFFDYQNKVILLFLIGQIAISTLYIFSLVAQSILSVWKAGSISPAKEKLRQATDFMPEIVVYFSADSEDSLYQLNQWLPSIKSSGIKTMVLTRNVELCAPINELDPDIPVLGIKRFSYVEQALPESVNTVLYVNNSAENFHVLRLAHFRHVQLLHGESDKGASSSKVTRAYDQIAVSGQRAIDRYKENGVNFADSQLRIIGRPVTDSIDVAKGVKPVQTILYAPTWEGHERASDFCSLRNIAVPTITWLLDNKPEIKIIIKPHPLTGTNDSELIGILETLKNLITDFDKNGNNQAERISTSPFHQFLEPANRVSIYKLFNEVDGLICDNSSVASDFLVSTKPMFICDSRNEGEDVLRSKYPVAEGSYVINADPNSLFNCEEGFESDPLKAKRIDTAQYILGDFDGSATDQFHLLLQGK